MARAGDRFGLTYKIGAAFSLALICGSCSPPTFDINTSGSGTAIQLKFYEPGLIWSSRIEPCVAHLTVVEEGWPVRRPKRAVWKVRRNPGSRCIRLRSVDIGKVPRGFTEEINQLPLRVGRMYASRALALDSTVDGVADQYDGLSMPWFVCSGAPVRINWKNEYRLENPPSRCRA